MKYILHIAASLRIGGAEKVARDIGLHSELEYQNHFIVFGNEVGVYEKALLEQGNKIFHIESPGVSYVKFLKVLKKLMQTYHYTAVHSHTMFNSGWVMYIAKKMKIPVRIAHAHSALDIDRGFKVKIYEAIMRHAIIQCATDLVACGEKAGIRLFGEKVYRERCQLILNGIDIETFRFHQENRKKIRKMLELNNCFVIGHVGRLAEVKNQKYLLEIMPEIVKRRPNTKLLLLGEGEDRPMLKQKIADLGIQNSVIMQGNVMEVADYLSAMDVFAFPSLYEGMPLSIIEVQANGLPCVLSTSVPEDVYLTDLIQPLDLDTPEAWIEVICSSERVHSEQYADLLKQSGFDVTTMTKKIYDIYESKK